MAHEEGLTEALRTEAMNGGTDWTDESKMYVHKLFAQMRENPPTIAFVERGLLEAELSGELLRIPVTRLFLNVLQSMQGHGGLVRSFADEIARARCYEPTRRGEIGGSTADGGRRSRDEMSVAQRREEDIAVLEVIVTSMVQVWSDQNKTS